MLTRSRLLAYLSLIGNVVIWGAALPIAKPALASISPFNFLFYRYLIASLFMLPLLFFFKREFKRLKPSQYLHIFLLEVLQLGIGLSLLYSGLARSGALESSLIASTSPILITLGGILFLKEREDKNEWFGLMLSVAGTVVIIMSPFFFGQKNTGTASHLGNLLVFLYTLSWMAYTLLAKKYYANIPKVTVSILSCFVGLISFWLISALLNPIPSLAMISQQAAVTWAILYMGTLGSALAVGLYLYGQSQIEASEATLFTYLQPLIYIPLSVIWLKDQIIPLQLFGLFLILTGVLIAQFKKKGHPSAS